MSNSDLLTPFVKAILSGCRAFKCEETLLCERKGNTFTLNSYHIYRCSCFHITVNEISRSKMKNCPRRFTAVESHPGGVLLVVSCWIPCDRLAFHLVGVLLVVSCWVPCDGLASHVGGVIILLQCSCFMLGIL